MSIEEEIKQPKFRTAHQRALINLIFTANRIQGRQHDFFKPYGITTQQFNILRILRGQYPGKISGSELKGRMLDKHSDMSRLLERLDKKKLIERKACASDKRAADISITPKGLDILAETDRKLENLDQDLLRLTREEALQLSHLLDKSRG
jgi:DNA-binding MarR family transcriptional regulator